MIKNILHFWMFCISFDQILRALFVALPYEKVIKICVINLLISFKFLLASISVWPPDKKAIPGTSCGTFFLRQSRVFSAISLQKLIDCY